MKHGDLIKQMTLEEKCYLMSGKDFWQSRSVERLGIPNMTLSDGPHGIRKQEGAGDQLGPGLNIKRGPFCGRNFEYFSEGPYLAGKMAAGYVRGIQKNGVSACPKHFAANSQELRRMASDSVMDERILREIYLTGFEIKCRNILKQFIEQRNIVFAILV